MTVLSDTAIRARFASLLIGGEESRIAGSVYYFVPGKIFPSGLDEKGSVQPAIDWTQQPVKQWPGETAYVVKPGWLVSLRTRELVTMPNDLCGLWYQTDSLSRRGLLLVNMSIVPPGYQGPLTCTFVNFGKEDVSIKPSTNVSKLLFLPLDAATSRSTRRIEEQDYDGYLADMARQSPVSFLRISDRAKELDEKIDKRMGNFKDLVHDEVKQVRQTLDDAVKQARQALDDVVKENSNKFAKDARNAVFIAAPWALVAIGLLGGAQWLATKVLTTNINEMANKRADIMEARINQQLDALGRKPVFVYTTGRADSKEILARVTALENDMKELQSQTKK
jgi:deoxycytidine triphosphate deaminase/ElaB/YqjD/DUF883 family membrane-anchored ribosome-binding protein